MKIIIGDKFSTFAMSTDNLSYSDFLSTRQQLNNSTIVTGLGLSKAEQRIIESSSTTNNIKFLFNKTAAHCNVIHKHKAENCLISLPEKITEDIYQSYLILDDDNELLLDHVTGLHLQGMLLIEASRQMFIAVAMDYFSANFFSDNRYGSINKMNCTFNSFAFPIPALIRYTRNSIVNNPIRDCVSFCADIEIVQADRVVFRMEMEHSYYKSEKMKPIEMHKAVSACNRFIESVKSGNNDEEICIL